MAAPLLAITLLSGCGQTAATSSSPSATASEPGGVAPGGGDIPDNQVYLTYTAAAFTVQYPEGWVQTARSAGVTFQDKDNQINVTVSQSSAPTVASVRAAIQAIPGASIATDAHPIDLPVGAAIMATYQVDGPADAVTGKRPRLSVDRYEVGGRANMKAVLELSRRA